MKEDSQHKLTRENVDEIRRIYIKGDKIFGAKALAKKYGVSKTAIQFVVNNKTWV